MWSRGNTQNSTFQFTSIGIKRSDKLDNLGEKMTDYLNDILVKPGHNSQLVCPWQRVYALFSYTHVITHHLL